MSDWENEVVIQITEEGAQATNKALKEVTRAFQDLKKLSINPLQMKVGQNSFADAFSPKAMQEATGAVHHFGIEYEKLGKIIKSPLSGGDDRFASAFTKAGSGLDALKPKIDSTASGFREAANAVRIFRTLLIATGVEKFVANMVEMVDGLTNMQNKIRVVSDSLGASKIAFQELVGIATTTRTGLDDVATVFSRTARSVQELGYRQSETLQFTKVLSQAVKVGGSTAVESSNALIQLSQGLASGTLKGDELRSVLEQLPVVSQLIAKHFHIAVGQLRQFGMDGKLSAHEVFDAIIEGTDEMQRKFDQTTPTFAQGWEVFKTSITAASAVFQPLVQGMAKSMIDFAAAISDVPVVMDVLAQNFKDNSAGMETSWLGKVWEYAMSHKGNVVAFLATGNAANLAGPGFAGMGDALTGGGVSRLQGQIKSAKTREQEGLELMARDETSALDPAWKNRFKKFPTKAHKEGGLTFQELMYKSGQENEVANMEPENQAVTKEFFQKMNLLKDSIRENLIKNAGKGGSADRQMQQLMDSIRAEHEKTSELRIQYQLEDELYQMQQEGLKRSIELGKAEEKARADNLKKIYESDRAVTEGLNPFTQYNKEIEKFNDYLYRHPENRTFVEDAVVKMGYAYKTFAPIFEGISGSIADAAANSIVFGQNMHQALTQIAKDLTAKSMSALFQMGFNYLIGSPMPGINGGTPLASPVVPNAASGGYFGRGFDSGGYTGSYGRGNVAGVVHGQEFVVNANATARNRAMLESMNAGKAVGSGGHNVVVNNYAGADVSTSTNDDGSLEIRIHKAIAEKAPGIVAADMRNPNSRTSKALKNVYGMNRRS